VLAWGCIAASALAAAALLVDLPLIVLGGGTPVSAAAAGLGALALAALAGAVLAVPLALADLCAVSAVVASRRRGRSGGAARALVGAGLAFVTLWLVCDPLGRGARWPYLTVVALGTAGAGLGAWLVAAEPARHARAAATMFGAVALALDVWLAGDVYPELHQAAQLCFGAFAIALLMPAQRRLRRWALPRLVGSVVALATLGLAAGTVADRSAEGWRADAVRSARHLPRLAALIGLALDLDRDGYAAVAWGGDCDDLDRARRPLVPDAPGGGDANCNGADPPPSPTASMHGLAAPFGRPGLPAGTADLVVLITIDSLRADVVGPDLTPGIAALAARGVLLERVYAAGVGTLISLPLIHAAADGERPIATLAAERGIDTVAVVAGVRAGRFGFAREIVAGKDAQTITATALAVIREARARPLLLWLHYYDPHEPCAIRPGTAPVERPPLPRAYVSEVQYTDAALAALVAGLADDGRLARTVIALTGDHGEAMGEHGMRGHMRSGYEAVVRVPGVLVAPGLAPARYQQLASHRDLPATMLGALGLATEAHAAERFGRSWLRLIAASDAPLHEFVVTRSFRSASGRVGHHALGVLVAGTTKLVAGHGDQVLELYELAADPGERVNRAAGRAAAARAPWRRLALYSDLDGWPISR
jgi:hypothetical protein